jgi:hypothetical protein
MALVNRRKSKRQTICADPPSPLAEPRRGSGGESANRGAQRKLRMQ